MTKDGRMGKQQKIGANYPLLMMMTLFFVLLLVVVGLRHRGRESHRSRHGALLGVCVCCLEFQLHPDIPS